MDANRAKFHGIVIGRKAGKSLSFTQQETSNVTAKYIKLLQITCESFKFDAQYHEYLYHGVPSRKTNALNAKFPKDRSRVLI